MADDKIDVLRGKQVNLIPPPKAKGISFIFEKNLPVTDEDVIDREETIAQIEIAILPFRSVVKLGEQIQKAIRGDITEAMEQRLREDNETGLFDDPVTGEDEAPPAKPIPTITKSQVDKSKRAKKAKRGEEAED